MYSAREQQNNQRFDELAQTLHQFRNTVDNDIHGSIQQENLMIDMLGDNFSQLMTLVKRTSGNASLTRVVITILIAFVVIWTLYKLL